MRLRAIIADDEELVRRSIRKFLRNHDVESITECTDGRQALDAVRAGTANLLFLDLQMPRVHGMDVIATLGEESIPPTIIITAHANHAVDAFNFHIVDYILKPFGQERFDKAVARAAQRIEILEQADGPSPAPSESVKDLLRTLTSRPEYAHRLAVPHNGRIFLIETSEIQWLEAQGNLVLVHCQQGTFALRRPLHTIQKQLDPRSFMRLHRSTLVNVRFIREIQPWFKGHHLVVLKNGQELRMSRYQQDGIQQLIGAVSGAKG
ncbi:MAG TPA: LytTR family DNA-binding domain-containing protein [Acidobacteriaceae bacterium]|nr:LytTR family DNA-binding domain-containing protein [Acidobacteriaceae bacterium]